MIRAITVKNYLGELKRFDLAKPILSGFAIGKIDGLGPPKATINITDAATIDGGFFNSSRVGQREIVLTVYFYPSPEQTIETVRLEMYKYFPVKRLVELTIETDNRIATIEGYVEHCEPDIFSKLESAQITILCPNPYFHSEAITNTTFFGVDPLFEFPFANESLSTKLIEMGFINNVTQKSIFYTGDAEAGVKIYLHAIGPVENVTIYNIDTREYMKIDTAKLNTLTGGPFTTGDEIIISTVQGEKYISLLRAGMYSNILNCLDRTSDWFRLSKGENRFAYLAEDGLENLQFRMENVTLYEGV